MSDMLPAQDNHILLEKAYLLLHAADDILTNECHDLYILVRECPEKERQRLLTGKLGMLDTGISQAHDILENLLFVDRGTWNP